MPIEVFALADPLDGRPLRPDLRLPPPRRRPRARRLGLPGHDTIAAFVRDPASITAAMTAMVEENAIRAEVSPWEQALVAVTARDRGLFDTVEAAITRSTPPSPATSAAACAPSQGSSRNSTAT